ncbi:MAG: hypothetical protein ACXV79_02505 [Methylobacter sp.]
MDEQTQFDELLKTYKEPSTRERLYRMKSELGLHDDDAIWVYIGALEHYQRLYEAMPKSIASAFADITSNQLESINNGLQSAIQSIELQTGANIDAANKLRAKAEETKKEIFEFVVKRCQAETETATTDIKTAANKILEDTVKRVAAEANGHISKTIESQLSATIAKLKEAEGKLSNSVDAFGWKWATLAGGAVTGGIVTVLLVAWLTVGWQRSQVEALQAEASELQANIAGWEKLGARTRPTMCGGNNGKPGRACIRIDKAAGFYGDGKEENYAVIYGY